MGVSFPTVARVVVVDDDPAFAALVRAILGAQLPGLELERFVALEPALSHLGARAADCVLVDIGLPDGRGLEAVRALRAAAPATSIVVLTTGADEEQAVAALRAGAQDSVDKDGISDGQLARAVRYAIERTRAQVELAHAHEQLDALVGHAPAVIYAKDLEGRYTLVNPRCAETIGRDPHEVLGLRDADLFGAATAETFRSHDAQTLAAGEPTRVEQGVTAPDGTRLVYDSVQFPLRDAAGEVVGVGGIAVDVSERLAAEVALRDSEERLRLVLRNLPDATVILFDRQLRVLVAEGPRAVRRRWAHELPGHRLTDVWPEEVTTLLEPRLRAALRGEPDALEFRSSLDGTHHEMQTVPYRDAAGTIVGVVLVARDVTGARRAETARRVAEDRFRAAFAHAPIGMAVTALDGRIAEVNQAFCELTGRPVDDLVGRSARDLVGSDERRALVEGRLDVLRVERHFRHAVGHAMWLGVHATVLRDGEGAPTALLMQVQDVTERRQLEGELRHRADHDPLSGLMNRRRFVTELEHHVAAVHAERSQPGGALLVLDLDGFKAVNDRFGHDAGDELVVAVAEALRSRLRGGDIVARLGGDEFAVLLVDADGVGAETVASGLIDAVREAGGESYAVTASVGVALVEHDGCPAAELLRAADLAMYEAKAQGRGRHAWAQPTRAAA